MGGEVGAFFGLVLFYSSCGWELLWLCLGWEFEPLLGCMVGCFFYCRCLGLPVESWISFESWITFES